MFTTRLTVASVLTLAVVLILAGCSSNREADAEAVLEGAVDGGKAATAQEMTPSARQAGGSFVGRVAETMNAAGYTYVRLEKSGESVWAAAPETTVEVGEELAVSLDMPMRDFRSDTLDRTFDAVYFVGGFERGANAPDKAAADPHAGLNLGGTSALPDAGGSDRSAAPAKDAGLSEIKKPEGGYTVAELWDRSAELSGDEVLFRGKVVKYNTGILGRNWLHIQDGSGDPSAKNHDITVTTQKVTRVGEIVTVRGKLSLEKDFGAGYKYPVIVEDASVDVSL